MKLLFITLFPEFVKENFSHSMLKRAVQNGVIEDYYLNPRDFTTDKHKTVDDEPYGGGFGMVLKAQPFIDTIKHAKGMLPDSKVILLSPDGSVFSQSCAKHLSGSSELIFVAGHYEGFDERIKPFCDMELSIGDYVLTGGELPAMVIADAVCRLLPGVLGKIESTQQESFSDELLEYPQYTRPAKAEFGDVPEVLLSGNHAEIEKWRRQKSIEKTWLKRPELLEKAELSKKDRAFLQTITNDWKDKKDV